MIIGMLGFYQRYIPLFQIRIEPWRKILAHQAKPGSPKYHQEQTKIQELWTNSHSQILEEMKQAILLGPVLQKLNFDKRMYLKTNWSKYGMAVVLLQANNTSEAEQAEKTEKENKICSLDNTLSEPHL